MKNILLAIPAFCLLCGVCSADKFKDDFLGKGSGSRLPENFYPVPEKEPLNGKFYENLYENKNTESQRYNKNGWIERNVNPHTGRMGTDSPYKNDFFMDEKTFEIRKDF